MPHSGRIFTSALLAGLLILLVIVLADVQQSRAAANLLSVTTQPASELRIGVPLSFSFTISNTTGGELTAVTLTHELSPELSLTSLALSNAASCAAFPCNLGAVLTDATVLVTATYRTVTSDLAVGSPLGYTTTLTATELEAAAVVSDSLQITDSLSLLPYLRRPYPDVYTAWQRLSPPAGEGDVNYLYVAGGENCAGPTGEQALPEPIFAATDNGIYQLTAASEIGALPGWVQRGGVGLDVSHIISSTQGYVAGAFNDGNVLISNDGGQSWMPESLPNENDRIYRLATAGDRVFVAGDKGLFIREPGVGWITDPDVTGVIFSVAAAGDTAYASQLGIQKDTIWVSNQSGAPGTWQSLGQLPDPASSVQVFDYQVGSAPELLIGVSDQGIYRQVPGGFAPFAPQPTLKPYGIWRDDEARVYAATREPAGLLRFPATGGAGENLSSQAGAPPTNERLYTVNGRAAGACPIVGVGSREGNVWLRRPLP
jgi:hypothetical protein